MPPVPSISNPTQYANWNQDFFDDGPVETRVVTYEDPDNPAIRVAWGKTSAGFYFFLQMTPTQETAFWAQHATWRTANPGTHSFQSFARKPPTCGTPNTPPCP